MRKIGRRQFLKELSFYTASLGFGFNTRSQIELPVKELPILAYHDISNGEGGLYSVTPGEFRQHLEILYDEEYKLQRLDSYVNGELDIFGRKPVILTFDDAWEGQFRLEKNRNIDPDCAVGILKEFYKERGDFGLYAMFFVSFDKGCAFGNKYQEEYKLEWLMDHRMEVGHHTYDHKFLNKLTEKEIKEQISKADERFRKLLGARAPAVKIFSYPGGYMPKTKEGQKIIEKRFMAAVITGRNFVVEKAPYPLPEKLRFKIPRIGVYPERGLKVLRGLKNER